MDCVQKTYFFYLLHTDCPLHHYASYSPASYSPVVDNLCTALSASPHHYQIVSSFPYSFLCTTGQSTLANGQMLTFFKILSSSYHTSHMSLRYLVKPSCSKVDLVSKCSDQIHIFKYSYHIFLEQFMLHILNYMVRALHLLQLTMFWPICVTMNIQNDLFWFKCRHGYVCATGRTMALSIMLCSTPSHTSIRRCLKSSTSCTFV